MKLYLAGPMRGYPDRNFPAFAAAAEKLRARGHLVFSPAEHDAPNLRANLAIDVTWICLVADGVVFLEGWDASPGANAENALRIALGLPGWELEAFLDGRAAMYCDPAPGVNLPAEARAAGKLNIPEVQARVDGRLVRDILESSCRRGGLSLESTVTPGEPARNYELADRLGIGHVFGLAPEAGDTVSGEPCTP